MVNLPIFILLVFMNITLFTVKVENFDFEKFKCSYIFGQRESIYSG
jgi:hypothetical protein